MKVPSLLTPRVEVSESSRLDFDSVTRQYQSRVYRLILASLKEHDAAETLTQECFLKAYEARDRFRNECSIQTWLTQIAMNLVRDHCVTGGFSFGKERSIHLSHPRSWTVFSVLPSIHQKGKRCCKKNSRQFGVRPAVYLIGSAPYSCFASSKTGM